MEQRFPRSFLEKTSFMDLDHLQAKVRKYEILARFPGRAGRIYKERLADRKSLVEVYMAFNEALNQCSQMIHIDIGANVGTVTRIMAQSASKVFAFEPDPWAFSRLTQATESLGNVTLLKGIIYLNLSAIPRPQSFLVSFRQDLILKIVNRDWFFFFTG